MDYQDMFLRSTYDEIGRVEGNPNMTHEELVEDWSVTNDWPFTQFDMVVI